MLLGTFFSDEKIGSVGIRMELNSEESCVSENGARSDQASDWFVKSELGERSREI